MVKTRSVKFNFAMNVILTASTMIFPLITFPYISRILLPAGVGKVNFATSVVSYFSMIAMLGLQYFVMGSSSVRYLLALLGRTRSIEMDCHCYYGSEKGKYNEGLVLKKGKRTRRKQI